MVARLKRRERKRIQREIQEAIEMGSAGLRALAAANRAVYDAKVYAGTATSDDAYQMWLASRWML
jgi:hypothetical protein